MTKKVTPLAAIVVALAAMAALTAAGLLVSADREASEGSVLGVSASGAGALLVGVADDAGKYADDGGLSFFSQLDTLGMRVNRISVQWDPARPESIVEEGFLDRSMPVAAERGIRVVFAVYSSKARGLTDSADAPAQFAAFLEKLAKRYPNVKDYVIGNEPNQPRFWQPQFGPDGRGVSGAAYQAVLAKSYDALKGVDPTINVVGFALSPRGNDNPAAPSNISTSPVRFIRDAGQAYRASGRSKPLMDAFGFHPYPNSPSDALTKGYTWPNAGVANLARIKQAVWDAFDGTAQPTFGEGGSGAGLALRLEEIGWQVGVVPSAASAYHGSENVAVTDEANQARIYAAAVRQLACDPAVEEVLFFGLQDEADLDRFQAGLVRADGSKRPSFDAVRGAIAETNGQCRGTLISWRHSSSVIGADVDFGTLAPSSRLRTSWNFRATAEEEATYTAGIFRVARALTPSARGAIERSLTGRESGALATVTGTVKANYNVLVQAPKKRLAPGKYVYAIRLRASMNPARSATFLSSPFVVR